jgi:hypothetical protein
MNSNRILGFPLSIVVLVLNHFNNRTNSGNNLKAVLVIRFLENQIKIKLLAFPLQ